MICPLGEATEDAERWRQAYLLAEDDQAGELRQRSASGDEHARWQLASWLSDRARTEEAIEVIRPLADIADDVADLWPAGWLKLTASMSCANVPPAGVTTPCMSWLNGWNVTSTWKSRANSLLITGNCWRAGWPGSMT